jgi:hypothetical protein
MTFQQRRANTGTLAAICATFALLFTSCGGSGGPVIPAPIAAFSVSSTNVSFGSQAVGTTSTAQSATLIDVGNATLTFSTIQVTGPNAGDFTLTGNCGSSLAPQGQCTLNVTFTPGAPGARTASVVFTDNAAGSPQIVSLTGQGAGSIATLTASPPLDFGSQPGGTTTAGQVATLSNTGTVPLTIASIGFTGTNATDFAASADTCGSTLAPNASCSIIVTFTPAAAGSRSGMLVVTDNSNNVAGSTQTAAVTGTGLHDVLLTWIASPTSVIAGYYVYRGIAPGAEDTTPINSTPVNATTYVDTNVTPGTSYYYTVTAVASNGVTQSSLSNEASATVPTP